MPVKAIQETFKASDIWPNASAEGWGAVTRKASFRTLFNYQSIGNCGLTVVNNIGIQDDLNENLFGGVVPAEHKHTYQNREGWGGYNDKWLEPIAKFRKEWYKANQLELFKLLVEAIPQLKDYHCYIMTDGVNKHSKVRIKLEKYIWEPTTAWFCRMLVKHKVGYIVQSPLCVNAVHRSPTDFGWIRTWTWFPEGSWVYKPDKYLGYGTIMNKETLIENIQNTGNFKHNKVSKEVLERDYLESYKIP